MHLAKKVFSKTHHPLLAIEPRAYYKLLRWVVDDPNISREIIYNSILSMTCDVIYYGIQIALVKDKTYPLVERHRSP